MDKLSHFTTAQALYVLAESDFPPLPVPAVLSSSMVDESRLRFIRSIGHGLSGSVDLYVDRENGLELAGKKLFTDAEEPFREAVIHHSISHATLATVLGVSAGRDPKIYTQFYPDGSLESYMQSHWVSNTSKMIWIYGIAVGMAILHSRQIQHRDFKPSNILLDSKLRPRICDFGDSKNFQGMNSMLQSRPCGTERYLAPEVFESFQRSWAVDVYAFGLTVWQIVTGRVPFAELGVIQLGNHVISGQRLPLPDGIRPELRDLITRSWAQNPGDRPSFREIVQALTASGPILDGVDASAHSDYVGFLSQQTLNFAFKDRHLSQKFSIVDPIHVIRERIAAEVDLCKFRLELEYQGRVLYDFDPELALDFGEDRVISVHSRAWQAARKQGGSELLDIEVEMPNGRKFVVQAPMHIQIAGLRQILKQQHGVSAKTMLLGVHRRRLDDDEHVWAMNIPIIVEEPFVVLVHEKLDDSVIHELLFLANDRIDDARDHVRARFGPMSSIVRFYVDGIEPPGYRFVKDLVNRYWIVEFVTPEHISPRIEFSTYYDHRRPYAGGVIRRLREREWMFDPQVVFAQSTNDAYAMIDPASDGCFGSHRHGSERIEFHFRDAIQVNGIVLRTHRLAHPRGFAVSAVKSNGEVEVLANLLDVEELRGPGLEFRVNFEKSVTANLFRIDQTAPNWKGTPFFRLGKVEFLSNDPTYRDGVFRTIFRSPDVRKFVCVSTRTNQPERLYRMSTFDCDTHGDRDLPCWLQIGFPHGSLQLAGYAMRRFPPAELREWSMRGSNDQENWTVLHQVHEQKQTPHEPIEYFGIGATQSFKYFRLIRAMPRWDNKRVLHVDGLDMYGHYVGT